MRDMREEKLEANKAKYYIYNFNFLKSKRKEREVFNKYGGQERKV